MDQIPHYKDEIDWRDLLRKPEKLFGYSYIYVLVLVIAMGVLYVMNLNMIGRNAVPPRFLQDSTSRVNDIPFQSPRIIPPVDIMKAGISSPELIKKGHELFKANCNTCHGDNGQGDGPSAPMLNPSPRNFHSFDGWKNGSKVTQMYKTLEEGIRGGGMASYNYMQPEDRLALIHYIRTFAPHQPDDSPGDLKQLDVTYGLAKGMNVPGQIPVKKALGLIEKESAPLAVQIHETVLQIAVSRNMEADILKRVSFDENKVLISAAHMKNQVKNVDDFIKIISADPIQSGFKASVVRLSSREWSELYNYIFSVVKEETGK